MILEFLSVSALFQPHMPFDFLFHSFSQQASFGVTVCQKSFKKSESVGYFRSPLGTVGGDFFHEHGMSCICHLKLLPSALLPRGIAPK